MRLVLLTAVLIGLSACGEKTAQQGPPGGMPPTRVDTIIAETRDLPDSLNAVGSLRAIESVVVRPEVAGKLVRVQVAEGQRVPAGALLFALDADIAQAEVNEALAAVRASERNRPRIIELATKQMISKADADAALATSEINNAKLASAKARLAKTQIRAPFEGVVGLRQVSVGEYVNAGQALVELVRLNPLEVEFQVPETLAARMAVGQDVQVQTEAFPGASFAAVVSAVAPSVQVSGRSVGVRARLDNAENKLKPGQFAQVKVSLQKAAPLLMVPEQAVWPNGEQKTVYVVKDGKAVQVPVTLGVREPGWVVIATGIQAGDEIITAGQMKLFPGAPVMTAKPAVKK
ncbi:MAG TPA: efflux RND transporter periplasmic adaptor subunit [Arenimonas sp.]|nr:efflux RND transporter periplasmic adaptor subunit [Arenimonas sp.]